MLDMALCKQCGFRVGKIGLCTYLASFPLQGVSYISERMLQEQEAKLFYFLAVLVLKYCSHYWMRYVTDSEPYKISLNASVGIVGKD